MLLQAVRDGRSNGALHEAKTTALIKEKHFEAVRLIVHAGASIPPHKVTGDIMLHCLEGEVVLGLAASEVVLKGGDWLYLKGGELHALKGTVDSSVLLTILFEKNKEEIGTHHEN